MPIHNYDDSHARELIDLFNKIDAHLRLRYNLQPELSFSQVVESYGGCSRDNTTRRERDVLYQAAKIRNLLEHDKRFEGDDCIYTCRPEEHILAGVRRIWQKLGIDVTAISVWPKSDIEWLTDQSTITEALSKYHLQDYSQFPIVDEEKEDFVNIVTTVDIGKWLASSVVNKLGNGDPDKCDAIFDLESNYISEVLAYKKDKAQNYEFAEPTSRVFDVVKIFRETDRLEAVFLSPGRSKNRNSIQRIVTNWDIMKYLKNM